MAQPMAVLPCNASSDHDQSNMPRGSQRLLAPWAQWRLCGAKPLLLMLSTTLRGCTGANVVVQVVQG